LSEPDAAPQRQPLNSLATKIILFVFVSTFVTAVAVSWASIQSTHDSLLGAINRLYPLALEHSARRLTPWLAAARLEVEDLARDRAASYGSKADARLAEAVRTSWHVQALLAVGPDGALRARSDPELTVAPAALEALRTHAESALTTISVSGRSVLAVWAPRPAHDGGLLGVLRRSELVALLASELPDDASALALADTSGRVIVSTAPERERRIDLAEAGRTGGEAIREYDADGRHLIGIAQPVHGTDWTLALETPFEAAFGPVLDVVTRVFVTDLCIILLFSFLAYKVTATVVRPIELLSEAARRIAQGQMDLEIPEPNTRDEVGLLARTFNDMVRQLRRNQEEIETANRHLTDRNARLQQANEVLSQLSITDGLTKLHNHRFFQDHLTREIKRVGRTGEPLAMLMVDIDDFKQLNDRFGHAAGDELLARIARLLNTSVRESDLLARYGGEEFVILASNTDLEGAYRLGEKVRTAIAESSFILDDSLRPLRVTVSVGVAEFTGNRKRFFHAADQALYRAKAAGKNSVVASEGDD
jgi:diguanylate cyclase (GGDEF)-like protein